MATAVQLPTTPAIGPTLRPIVRELGSTPENTVPAFESSKHLVQNPDPKVITMEEIGYPSDAGVSPIAVSQPFQLFSEDAIRHMRSEIFTEEVTKKYKYTSNIAAYQLRGYASEYAPFVWDAWHHPDTLATISRIAGVDLVPVMDFEIGHVNISIKSEQQAREEIAIINSQKRMFAEDEGIDGCPWEDDKPIVGWHRDSYPFVCVLMLSDCTNMVGGETALRTSTGDVLKVRGPQMGCAAILQGRYITHQALRAFGTQERITMVTSFRPRSFRLPDDSVLNTVRPISDLSSLYGQFSEYRLEIMEERLRATLQEIRIKRRAGKKFDANGFKEFLSTQIGFLEHTNNELVDESKVPVGYIEEMTFPEELVNEARPKKRARA